MSDRLIVTARINKYVKNYLKKNGMKQWHLAVLMGYNPKKLSQLINGHITLGIDDLVRFCEFFQEPITTFIPCNTKKTA